MIRKTPKAFACALAAACVFAGMSPSLAHVIVGPRFFPTTLSFDDPGPNDEFSVPNFAYLTNPDGSRQYDISFEWQKTITPDLAVIVGNTFTHLNNALKADGAIGTLNGWQDLETAVKYVLARSPEHEFILSAGVEFEWGHTGNASVGAEPYTHWGPAVWFGKGMGDLPVSLNFLRPLALTGNLGVDFSTHPVNVLVDVDPETGLAAVDIEHDPTFLVGAFSLQYNLIYMNSNVLELNPEFLRHLIPLVEVNFAAPFANIGPSIPGVPVHTTVGTVNTGVIYASRYFQVGAELLIPLNSASGKHVGARAILELFLDDIFPDSIGRPLFAPPDYVSPSVAFYEKTGW
ncbi:MAG TPA: hypothetical protein VFF88_08400 [Methylocella sp.]|nr:hypothetical protein [Methylocella sp.]